MRRATSDKEYGRRILQGLNKGETKNSLAGGIRYAGRGIIREKNHEMRINVASSLNLVILCTAIWNTIYMQKEIRALINEGYKVNVDDLIYLSPFIHSHINFYGQFSFNSLPKIDTATASKVFEPLY